VAAVAGIVVVADQASKWWALQALGPTGIDVVWTLRLRLVFNTGTAFGLGSRFAPLIAILAVVVVAVLLRTGSALEGTWARLSLGLVLGGAVGNLLDRLFRAGGGLLGGAVVDFIDFGWWPVFNVADMAITGGAALLALTAWRDPGIVAAAPDDGAGHEEPAVTEQP
jgi:signal peptidase II